MDRSPFVHAVGNQLVATVERHSRPGEVDHVWIRMSAGDAGPLVVSVNTLSKRALAAGFDGRIRLGILREEQTTLPPHGLVPCPWFAYEDIEERHNIYFERHERPSLEELLLRMTREAALLEAWGEPYLRGNHRGLHQIHSRRASLADPGDLRGRDGALRFHFAESRTSTLLLFKFSGQP